MTNEITNSEDIIDSRDVIARIEELHELRDAHDDCRAEYNEESERSGSTQAEIDSARESYELACKLFDSEAQAELAALESLAEQSAGYAPDWGYGETLIRDSYFEDYARELADDLGYIDTDSAWPSNCIDWKAAARELQVDYTAVDFDGVTYWIR